MKEPRDDGDFIVKMRRAFIMLGVSALIWIGIIISYYCNG